MKNPVFFLSVFVSFILISCSQTQNVVYQPSFLATAGLPNKPSFENNLEFADFYLEGYGSLKALTNSTPSTNPTSSNNRLNISHYLIPAFSINFNYGNYFNDYPNLCYYNPTSIGVNNNYLYPNSPSGYYSGNYYSQYSNGWYWGTIATGPADGTTDFHHPKQNFSTIDPVSSQDFGQERTPQIKTSPYKIIYAKPVEKTKQSSQVRVNYNYNEVYHYASKEKSVKQKGYYRSPTSVPISYARPSSSSFPSSNWNSTNNAPKTNYNSGSSGYNPPRSSGNSSGGSSGGSGYTPKQNNSSSGSVTPKK